ncbi:RNA polymerase sigma factor [Pedobacter steynii]
MLYDSSNHPLKNEFTLSQDECYPVFIKYFEGYTNDEIAAALNIPLHAVKASLRKSKRRMRVNFRIFTKRFLASLK